MPKKKDDESPSPRLLPKITFGTSAAILSGVIVVAVAPVSSAAQPGAEQVMTTSTLGGVINAAAGPSIASVQTTCCGGNLA
ncbi:MAG: hypothetical protein JWO75_2998 [Actinomycetia bacterium]|jgi:hypothetical protein|nr:hypothetical protein [Actinomycetes bacterium]